MNEQLASQRELPANYKERSLLRDRVRESIPECPELEFKFIFGKHVDENDAKFVIDNMSDSDILLVEFVGHDVFSFNHLMSELEGGRITMEEVLEYLTQEDDSVDFPEFYINLIRQAHEKGKIVRSADIFFTETADIDYLFSELEKFTDRIKSEKWVWEDVLKETEALILLFAEAQFNRERNIDINTEGVIVDILNSHKELMKKGVLNISVNLGLMHLPLGRAFSVRGEKTKDFLQKGILPLKNPIQIAYAYFLYTGKIPRELLIQTTLYLIIKRYLNIDRTPEDALRMLSEASMDEELTARIYDTFINEDEPAEKLREIVSGI